MSYPILPLLAESDVQVEGGFDAARATNGALRVRRPWPADKRRFSLVHLLSLEQASALQAFYDANRFASFPFTWPPTGQVHTCCFVTPPQPQSVGWHRRVSLTLEEV